MCSIPAMSSECERVFSQAKLLITGQRMRLKADLIEATQCFTDVLDNGPEGSWVLENSTKKDQYWGGYSGD